jgi:hypothetical protein
MYSSKKTGEKEAASHHASAGELGELGDVDEDAVMKEKADTRADSGKKNLTLAPGCSQVWLLAAVDADRRRRR